MTARTARPALAVLGALVMSLLLALVPVPAGASTTAEGDFASRLNAARSAAGLRPLAVADDLTTIARAHSQKMASSSTLYHNPDLASQVQSWTSLGENVGYGGSVVSVHDALMNSAPHRANILSGTFTQVGVGVVVSGSRTWVTQVFRKPSSSYAPASFTVGGGIGETWRQFSGLLGAPTTNEHDVPGGRGQRFERGEVLWSPSTGAKEVHGGILEKYRALGGPASALGLPTTHEHDAPWSRRSRFQRGQVMWTPHIGAVAVYGGINERYDALAGPLGPLGLPTKDEHDVAGGRSSWFERGRVYWTPGTGAHEVYGGIAAAYVASGGPGGWLGFPTTGEYAVPGGRRSDFQHGSITWHAATNTISAVRR